MTRLACAAVLSALLLQVLAQPQHGHHRHQHKRVNFDDPSLYKNVDWDAVFGKKPAAPGSAPAPAPASAPDVVSAATDFVEGASNSLVGFGGRTNPIANGNVDQYMGNVGIPWGSNIIKIPSAKASQYKYTVEFNNAEAAPMNIVIWNKSGPDGQPNSGQFSSPALSFKLQPGKPQMVAFDENSQVAWCHFTGKKTSYGAYDCTFGEADFGNASNGGWSGYDVSSIQNSAGNSETVKIESANGATSSNLGNNYVSDKQEGGIGGNLFPGKVHLTATWG